MNSVSLKAVVTIISFHVSAVASFAQSPCPAPKGEVPETAKNIIAEFQAWSVFVETDPDECFAAADPVETTVEPVTALENLCIGASSLTVACWPKREVNGQLSFRSGYEFDPTVAIEFIIVLLGFSDILGRITGCFPDFLAAAGSSGFAAEL